MKYYRPTARTSPLCKASSTQALQRAFRNVARLTAAILCLATQFAPVASVALGSTRDSPGRVDGWVRKIEAANKLLNARDLDRAETLYRSALAEAQSAGDDERVGVVLQNIGCLLDRKGRTLEAEKAYLRGIDALNRTAVPDATLLVRAHVGLSTLYLQTGQYAKAETLIRQALTRGTVGARSDLASLKGNLAVILAHKQQFGDAEQMLRETAEMCLSSPGDDIQEAGAIALENLATLEIRAGRTVDAIESYRRAVAVMEALPNPTPTTFSVALAAYADAVRGSGSIAAADALFRKAIAVAEAQLGPTHGVLGTVLDRYAVFLRDVGRKDEARTLAARAQRIQDASERDNLTGYTVDIKTLLERR